MKNKNDTSKILSANLFPVVGIGASAGGLDAFKKLLKSIPEDSGIAYVLVQHLDPNHESMLPELLQKVTNIPVLEISDDIKVKPDHIYILPSNKMLVANDGVLELSARLTNKNERNLPIDLFFTSLAEIHQSHAIGIVLSGTGSDGTQGLKAIKDHGGITFAQDRESATFDAMPHNAMQAEVVDFILAPELIPEKLIALTRKIYINDGELQNLPLQEEEVFKQILLLLRVRKGNDFTYYKQTTIRRRILRRMALNKNEEPGLYLKYLRENKTEQDVLYQDLLIPVTSFFRDSKVFDHLCDSVFPEVVKNKPPSEQMRIWVAGCSTGQEAYSIAMCVKEFLNDNGFTGGAQIFATDLSEPAILKARAGIYTKTELEGLTPQRIQDFFSKINGSFQVNKQIREMCVFAAHNFLKDPPFGKVDFISCRNVLIYMEPYLQKKALTTFHYALNPHGFLLLGKSETITTVADLFVVTDKHDKLFNRKGSSGKFMITRSPRSEQNLYNQQDNIKSETLRTDFQKTADDIILSKYTPTGVVVNEAMDIVHFRGKTSNYLEQSSGKPSHNLLQMAKSGLAFELRSILHKVKKENALVVKENVPIVINSIARIINIEALPLPNIVEPHYLILFHEQTLSPDTPLRSRKKSGTATQNNEKDLRIHQLEQELAQSREDMRGITEDQEALNEELQSANEELLSGSEELQSLNEELETSKEELQSTNEELTVVNQEMIGLNEHVTVARNYAEAIIANIGTPLLVLDKHLRIKSANRAFYKTFQVNELETEGKLIYDIGNRQWDIKALRILLQQILPEQSKVTDYEVRHTFQSIGERIMLLNVHEIRREDDHEKLILLAIADITEHTLHLVKEKELLSRFHDIVFQVSVGITIYRGHNFLVEMANHAFLEIVGKQEMDFVGLPLFNCLPETRAEMEPLLTGVLNSGTPYYANEVAYSLNRCGKGELCYFNFSYQPLRESNGAITGVVCVANEVTDLVRGRKKMEAQATMVENLLMTAPGFVSILSGPDHVYVMVNEQYQQLFGKREIKGKPIMVALPELTGQGFDTLLDKVYTTGEPYVGIDIPVTLARDINLAPELRYFNFSYQPMFDEDAAIHSILVFGYEVTDQVVAKNKNLENEQLHTKELEEKVQQRTVELSEVNDSLQEKNKELEKINKELESFTYVSSHDLQEPLRKIQTFTTRLLEKEKHSLSDHGKDYFNRIQKSANRMQLLILDLLAFSRINNTETSFEKTNLSLIVEEVKTDLKESIDEKHAKIETFYDCEINVIAFQFRQLMQNLIENALKFSSPERPPHIKIQCEIIDGFIIQRNSSSPALEKIQDDKKYYHISIADNGIGFDPQFSDRIFQVFQRLHSKEEYPGTGIGLAIVKKIVEHHNGVITATSELNKGAIFTIYIPTE